MAIFDDLPDLIGEILGDLGTNEGLGVVATFTSETEGTYDEATGVATTTPTPTSVRVIMEDVSGRELIEGLVEVGDKKILIPAVDMPSAPETTETFTADGDTYTILRVVTVQPGADPVLYEVFCRKG